MLCNPLLHFDAKPEAVDAEGNNGKNKPNDVVAEKLCAVAVEDKAATVNGGVLCEPSLLDANSPRRADAKGKNSDKSLKNGDTY